jgi:hypothetical protein
MGALVRVRIGTRSNKLIDERHVSRSAVLAHKIWVYRDLASDRKSFSAIKLGLQ